MAVADPGLSADEKRLAELGYKQELNRGWSGFSNFAISLTIICILSGCFTTYGQAWNNGGPIAISIGWPVISILVLLVGLSMAELASKFPTAGGIYYWAYRLGGVRWAWFTGWFNLIGLVAIIAGVDYGAASFLNSVLSLYGLNFILNFTTTNLSSILHHTFVLFVIILAAHGLINVFSSNLVSLLNRVSAWWMLGGVIVIVAVLIFGPSTHQSASFVFGQRNNNSGFHGGAVSGGLYWFFILPIGFLLTMYTFTGYDASAHLSEETHDAERAAPRGLWTSIAYSAVGGWVLLLAITFAATHIDAINKGGGGTVPIIESALSTGLAKLVLDISTIGQLFCGMGCVAAASRMVFAFSRDGAVPGHQLWRRLNQHRTPTWSVLFVHHVRARDHDPGDLRQQRRPPGRVLRRDVDHDDRPLHRLHPPRLPPLPDGRQVRARGVEPRPALPVDQPDRDHLGRAVRDHLQPADDPRGGPVEQRLQLEQLQLRAARHDRRDRRGLDRVGGRRQEHVQGPGQDR